MSRELTFRLLTELQQIPLIDPHSHINPLAAASRNLAEILGYHYYTELAHSVGLPRDQIQDPSLTPREKVGRLVPKLSELENTAQHAWLMEMCRTFFGFEEDRITPANWERLHDLADARLSQPDWEEQVLRQSGLQAVYLTNDFDDPLEGFDTRRYVPCLRTDELVFHGAQPGVRERLSRMSGIEPTNAASLRRGLQHVFEHFRSRNARACAISLPPDFEPQEVSAAAIDPVLKGLSDGRDLSDGEQRLLSAFVFWTLAGLCADFRLPFDLMIGVNRRVYEAGVYQGQDLFDRRCSLYPYRRLFNAFPQVVFPVSILAHDGNQELVSYSWIFPNVVTLGHWWYSNIPAFIELDCRSRLQAVPLTKQIGYYSDMYKLEFGLPKFNMYRRILAGILGRDFVIERGWSEERAVSLGRALLRDNVERWFGKSGQSAVGSGQ